MEIKIRETKEEDFGQIKNLLDQNNVWLEISEKTFMRMLKKNKGFYLVAESDGKIVGTIFGTHDGGLLGYIYKLAINKNFQRKKIATRLVNELLKRFKKIGIYWIYGHIYNTNKNARRFFKTVGFKVRKDLLIINNWKE